MADEADERRAKHAAYMREYRKKNPEKFREMDKRKAQKAKEANPERFAELQSRRSQRWWAKKMATETPEERVKRLAAHKVRSDKYRQKDMDKIRAMARQNRARAYAADPQKYIDITAERREKLRIGEVTKAQWKEIIALFRGRCAYCRRKAKLTQDHVVPLSKGGPHLPENVVPACQSCNSRKGDREWPRPLPPTDEDIAAATATVQVTGTTP